MRGMNRNLPIAFALLISLGYPAKSEAVDFAPPKSYPVGTSPSAVVVGDFNGDGKPDLAVANSGSANVSVLLGNGDGTFKDAVNSSAGPTPNVLAVGDFNGDHKLDLIVISRGNTTTGILGAANMLLGNGDGTFQTPVTITAGQFPFSMAVGDFNGDKKIDLIVGDQMDGSLSVFLGNGDGTFQPVRTISLGGGNTGISSIVVADFNGDTNLDVVAATFTGAVILAGHGDGTFQAPVPVADSTYDNLLLAGDFDNDHKVDLLVQAIGEPVCGILCLTPLTVILYRGNGDGTFNSGILVASSYLNFWSANIVAADFNDDNKLDWFCEPYNLSEAQHVGVFFFGVGSGGAFVNASAFESSGIRAFVAAADFNGDVLPDLVLTDRNSVTVLLNTSPISGADLALPLSPVHEFSAFVGDKISFTLPVFNEGPEDASGVILTENLPSGLKFVSALPSQGTCTGTTTITCDLGAMTDPSRATVEFTVTPTAAGTFTDAMVVAATQPDLNSKNNSFAFTFFAGLSADLSVSATASETTAKPGDKVTISVTVSNSGPDAATNVTLTVIVPNGNEISNVTISSGSCNVIILTCALGTLAPGANVTMTYIIAIGTSDTIFDNDLYIGSDQPDPNTQNNSTRVRIAQFADLSVSATASETTATPGDKVTISVTVSNGGPNAATDVTLTDGVTNSTQISNMTISSGSCNITPALISCALGTLAPGANVTMTYIITIGTSSFDNNLNISSDQPDPNIQKNSTQVSIAWSDFTVSPAATSLTVERGAQVIDVFTFPAQGGFTRTIGLECSVSGPSPMPTCGISPASVTPGANATLTVNAAALSTLFAAPRFEQGARLDAAWLPLGLFGFILAMSFDKKRRGLWALCILLLVATILPEGCGSNVSTGPTRQNYTVTVTATSGTLQHSTIVSVVVN